MCMRYTGYVLEFRLQVRAYPGFGWSVGGLRIRAYPESCTLKYQPEEACNILFWGLGFRVIGFRVFWALGFRVIGFRVFWGFRV